MLFRVEMKSSNQAVPVMVDAEVGPAVTPSRADWTCIAVPLLLPVTVLRSEARDESTNRVSVMRQGHINRAGATYYFVYQNTRGALRAGEDVTIEYGGLRLEHVPVL